MNAGEEGAASQTALLQSGLELRSRRVLEEGLSRIDAGTRSRLNRARQAALVAASRPSYLAWFGAAWTRRALMPATGVAAAAVLVAAFLLTGGGQRLSTPVADNPASALDVLDLVTDDDAMNLMEDNDSSFYEWAAAQVDSPGQSVGHGAGASAGPGAGVGVGGTTT